MLDLRAWWPWRKSPEPESPSVRLAARFFSRLENFWAKAVFPEAHGEPIAVLLTSWGRTGVPFCAAELALALRQAGWPVTVLGDWTDVGDNAADAKEVELVQELFARLARILPAATLDEGSQALSEAARKQIESQIFENLVRRERSEAGARAVQPEPSQERSFQHAGRIAAHLTRHRYSSLVLPGGLWSLSGLYAAAARETGTPWWTFDSGRGYLTFARDGAAAHFPDFAEAFQQGVERTGQDAAWAAWVESEADRLLAVRRRGDDQFRLQPQETRAAEEYDLLVPLNYRVDTAAMGREQAFRDVTSWIDAVIAWAAARPGIRLAIRQHPCERLPDFQSKEDYSRINTIAPDRIRFYSCHDPVNTYDLIEKSRVVLPYTSRTGIEAALLGKPVILGTRSYYGNCPFAQSAETEDDYFRKVETALSRKVPLTSLRSAALAYVLAETCALEKTIFTPMPSDFEQWCEIPPDDLWAREEQKRLITGLGSRTNFFQERLSRSGAGTNEWKE